VAFPALGTGVGEVPMEQGARLILEAVRTFAALEPRSVRDVHIVLRNEEARGRWREILRWM
jgi:O-acetyl-ADP-ribose deacetylase (regulator of RNase III)